MAVGVAVLSQQSGERPPGWAPDGVLALQRLLSQWGVAAAPVAPERLAERLSGWLDWRDAIALSQALGGAPAGAEAHSTVPAAAAAAEAALHALNRELQAGFADPSLVHGGAEATASETATAFRLHHANQQRAMAARIAPLRARLRGLLTEAAPALARLAALDAVFEQAFAAREQRELAALPSMLARRALVLRAADLSITDIHATWPPSDWRGRLWHELQQALQAELALRLQPLLGLMEALRHTAAGPASAPSSP